MRSAHVDVLRARLIQAAKNNKGDMPTWSQSWAVCFVHVCLCYKAMFAYSIQLCVLMLRSKSPLVSLQHFVLDSTQYSKV